MLHLMNSAMMPQPGYYELIKISVNEFANRLCETKEWCSYIGYPQTAQFIQRITGIEIPVSREQTQLRNKDEMLIIRLKYRVNPDDKKKEEREIRSEDFEYFYCKYSV